ncbi:PadR family transcriptional regulator [Clostridium folliculivorans]|uniref:PadR family transcriptional regulator n=1 Tax=Clostridium folliculivorans TaxID=2886038 RepID=A0A9W6DBU5_9CLOT|nr:helix-turn-helix transcriptional regulator [Clostridium folliculivorans]GKU26326.1 PadR family transcriptional regulator [Clostridium folliculivorans]GKU32119.1 PadR family transcriptional regulator [Clostridium folliculivorans]
MDKELMRGSIDILLLSLIEKEDLYGYEIAKKLKEKSNELYSMGEGTLYPALQRLEKKELIHSYWSSSENGGRRKYYRITENGRKRLSQKLSEWDSLNKLINTCREGFSWKNLIDTLVL